MRGDRFTGGRGVVLAWGMVSTSGGAVVSMRAAGLRLMVRPWWWAVGIPEAWQVVRGMVSTSGAWW